MKKIVIIIVSLFIQLIYTVPIESAAAEDLIERKVLLNINWQKNGEGTIINLVYLSAKKINDQETTAGTTTYQIFTEDLTYTDSLNAKDIRQYLEKSGSTGFVYKEDNVFGNFISIYKDVSDKKRSNEELNQLKEILIENVEELYSQEK
ncbi:hypothetical protein [Bacillus weihaiensis]|uniref:Uncharacterized protein n=1 Tax=Bacillus weihaiensis TaxID=1547283 RepID=A0A1L3MRQ6_9BACI|nr:hypothetical protein [Bacillus weihaiensis]APH05039.1 hypothetical protein A9C19_09920 [Bacillus weihaiensis]